MCFWQHGSHKWCIYVVSLDHIFVVVLKLYKCLVHVLSKCTFDTVILTTLLWSRWLSRSCWSVWECYMRKMPGLRHLHSPQKIFIWRSVLMAKPDVIIILSKERSNTREKNTTMLTFKFAIIKNIKKTLSAILTSFPTADHLKIDYKTMSLDMNESPECTKWAERVWKLASSHTLCFLILNILDYLSFSNDRIHDSPKPFSLDYTKKVSTLP